MTARPSASPARRRLAGAALLLALPALAPAQLPGLAARVNGAGITNQQLEQTFQDYLRDKGRSAAAIRTPEAFRKLRREALDRLVEDELLFQEARRTKMVPSSQELAAAVQRARSGARSAEAFQLGLERRGLTEATFAEHVERQLAIGKLVEKLTRGITATDAEVRRFYQDNPAAFSRPEEVRVRQILVKADPGAAPEVRARARAEAEALLARLAAGEDFAELARTNSQDASAQAGGDLGFLSLGGMEPPFAEAALALRPGQTSGVVETASGYHLIRCEERRDGDRVPEAEVREAVRRHLRAEKGRRAVLEKIEALRAKAKVEIDPHLDPGGRRP